MKFYSGHLKEEVPGRGVMKSFLEKILKFFKPRFTVFGIVGNQLGSSIF